MAQYLGVMLQLWHAVLIHGEVPDCDLEVAWFTLNAAQSLCLHLQGCQPSGIIQLFDGGRAADRDHHGHQLLHLLPPPLHERLCQAALHQPLEAVLQHLTHKPHSCVRAADMATGLWMM